MAGKRKSYSASFKAQLALEALRGDSTANELAARHGVHPTLISNWKKALLDGASSLFAEGAKAAKGQDQPEAAELFERNRSVSPGGGGRRVGMCGVESAA